MPVQVNPCKLLRELHTLPDGQIVDRPLVVKNLTVKQWNTLLSNPNPLPTISDALRYALDELADLREEAKDRLYARPGHKVLDENEVARLPKAKAGKLGQAIAEALVELIGR